MARSVRQAVEGRNLAAYAGGLAARGLEVAGKFGLYALTARLLGHAQAGMFFICLTWINLGSTASRLGLERTSTRHIAAELAVGRGLAARRVIWRSLLAVGLASLVAAGLTLCVARPAAAWVFHEPDLAAPLMVAGLALPVQTLTWGAAFVLIGLKRGVAAQLVLSALPCALTLLGLGVGVRSVTGLLEAYALAYAACGAYGFALIVRDWRGMTDRDVPGDHPPLPPLTREARPYLLIEIVQTSVLSLPTLLLGRFGTLEAVSAFNIALRLSNLVNTVLVSVAITAAPSFAEHYRLGEWAALRRVMSRTRSLAMAIGLPPLAAMAIEPGPCLRLLGEGFGIARPALEILALGQFVNALFPCQDTLLAMMGEGAALRRLNVMQLVACGGLGLGLIPAWGMQGAAVASAGGLALYAAGCGLVASRRLRWSEKDGRAQAERQAI